MLDRYLGISPKSDLTMLQMLGAKMNKMSFLNVNSTKAGGGVAEILQSMIPILEDLGIQARWEVIEGDDKFFETTKKIHNAIQGRSEEITEEMWQHHYEINRTNAEKINLDADMVLIHDPQPSALVEFRKTGRWVWRCHIDVSNPRKDVWDFLARYCKKYDGAIYSVAQFARSMGIDEFIIPPSIDPLSEKNRELSGEEIGDVLEKLRVPVDRPVILQVSRFDIFKDPIGVIQAFKIVKRYNDCILVLAGSPATDDPEGVMVLNEVTEYAAGDPDIHILLLPAFSDREINALQRSASVILQKSLREGFGLTVSESMWKGKPVIGGAVGGIPLQILHGVNGFLVNSVEGAAFRTRQLLNNPEMARVMGQRAKEHARTNFLITRQVRDYLSVWYSLGNKGKSVLEL